MKNIIYLLVLINFQFVIAQNKIDTIYTVKNIENINDNYSNFGATYFENDKIIFSAPRKSKIIKDVWEQNNEPFLDLFVGTVNQEDNSIDDIKTIGGKTSTPYNESNPSFTSDFKTVYFTRNNYKNFKLQKDSVGYSNLGIYRGDVSSATKWTNIKPVNLNNVNYSIAHPALSSDGKTLYFISDMPGGYGKTDIYKVTVNTDGTLEKPVNLGQRINTEANEIFPYIVDNTLYFSSDRSGGKGNLDIYYLAVENDAQVINLAQLNTSADDFAFVKKKGENEGYFSSNRKEGKGGDDIYSFSYIIKKPVLEVVSGYILDENNKKIATNAIVKVFDQEGNLLATKNVAPDTKYQFELPRASNFKLEAEATSYLKTTLPLNTDEKLALNQDIILKTEKTNEQQEVDKQFDYCQKKLNTITLDIVYFDFDEYTIREIGKIKLNQLVELLKECNTVNIKVNAYADSRGAKKYNENLSLKRTQAIKDYLLQNGIDEKRIQTFGYGESQLLNRCKDDVKCTPEEHQKNRRAEFKIIKQ